MSEEDHVNLPSDAEHEENVQGVIECLLEMDRAMETHREYCVVDRCYCRQIGPLQLRFAEELEKTLAEDYTYPGPEVAPACNCDGPCIAESMAYVLEVQRLKARDPLFRAVHRR